MEKKESTYKGGKIMKTNETDSKLENLDEARKRRAEHKHRLIDAFKFSDSDSDIQPSPPKRKSSVEEYDNHQVLENFLEENVFTESENSEEEEENLYIFNLSITDIYKKIEISCNENCLFNVLSLALYDDCKYEYELRKTIYSYVEHKQEYFKRYLTEDNIDDYIKEMRRATTSGGEIELIALSELYKINLPIWDLLTQKEPKIKVMNPLANKNVLLYQLILKILKIDLNISAFKMNINILITAQVSKFCLLETLNPLYPLTYSLPRCYQSSSCFS